MCHNFLGKDKAVIINKNHKWKMAVVHCLTYGYLCSIFIDVIII